MLVRWQVQRLLNQLRGSLAAPSRNPRTAVVIGRLLAVAFLLTFVTGLYSHFIQEPLPGMQFLTRPIWLYQVSQGIHITAGIVCFPLIFAKLYAVFPELFQTPAVRSFPHFLERASIALFVAASLVQLTIGLLNTYQWYALFPFAFRQTHFALSFVIIGSLAIHIAVKLATISKYWNKRDAIPLLAARDAAAAASAEAQTTAAEVSAPRREKLRGGGSNDTRRQTVSPAGQAVSPAGVPVSGVPVSPAAVPVSSAATSGPDSIDELERLTGRRQNHGLTGRVFEWIDRAPAPRPSTSRRGFFATVAVASAALVTLTAGQSFRVFDATNLFGPRKNDTGPQGVPVNRTAKAAKVLESAVSPDWRLTVANGTSGTAFTYQQLRAMPQYEVYLPIACVEGWSQYATWRGPRLSELVDFVGARAEASIRITSLEQNSSYAVTTMQPEFVRDELTLVALELNGETLDIDHGYPARVIAPARPGVLQTKWLSSLEVLA